MTPVEIQFSKERTLVKKEAEQENLKGSLTSNVVKLNQYYKEREIKLQNHFFNLGQNICEF